MATNTDRTMSLHGMLNNLVDTYAERMGFDDVRLYNDTVGRPGIMHIEARRGNRATAVVAINADDPEELPSRIMAALQTMSDNLPLPDYSSPRYIDVRMNAVESVDDVKQLTQRHLSDYPGINLEAIVMTKNQHNIIGSGIDIVNGIKIKVVDA